MTEKKELKEEELDKVIGGEIIKDGRCNFVCNECGHTWKDSFLKAKCPECGSKNITKEKITQ